MKGISKNENPMKDIRAIKEVLLKVQRTYGVSRAESIGKLQDIIWEEPPFENEELEAMLVILAGDLNFYETDERDRDEGLGYYGDARLDEISNAALEQIEKYLKENK